MSFTGLREIRRKNRELGILVVVYIIAGTIDFIAGTLNAILTSDVAFSSRMSQLGIMRRLLTLACMILVIPFALMLPFDVGVYTLSILYTGICASEVYSILGHAGIVKDGNKHKNIIAVLFDNLLGKVLKEKGVSDDK